MGKSKKNKLSSDALLRKKSLQEAQKKPNPFEIQTSKCKFSILNRDVQQQNIRFTGAPGAQKARAINKRKHTLGVEFLSKHKTNRFVDQRKDGRNQPGLFLQGENENGDRRSGTSRRKEMFNLNDSVKLTHRGQTLEEIERFDDAVDGDDSDEDGGQLDAEFMEAAHFGGGENTGNDDRQNKDRKTVIEEMIAESKRRKAEKQRENDEVYDMTEKLDQNWQSLLSVVGGHMKSGDVDSRPQLEDYDRVMREMIFERRGVPTDRLKSQEELARIEKEKLEKLERERLARMKGNELETKNKHRSADDLDDGYLLQPIDKDGYESNNEGDVDAEDGLYNPRNIAKEAGEDEDGKTSESDEGDEDDDSENDEDGSDNLSDLKDDTEEDQVEEVTCLANPKAMNNLEKNVDLAELERQKVREKASQDLPFTFQLPIRYEELSDLLNQYNPVEQLIIIERMLKSNNAKFVRENKSKMISLFAYLVQYLNDLFIDPQIKLLSNAFQLLEGITPHLYDLIHLNPSETSICFLEVIKEKQEIFHKHPRQYPALDTLIFLKLIPILFSASDFRHPVVSPAMIFISEILARCPVRSRKDIISGLFLVTTVIESTEQSKRFLPAALNFLNGIIYLCIQKRSVQVIPVVPPFKSSAPLCNLLVIEEYETEYDRIDLRLTADDFMIDNIDDSFKLRCLYVALGMINSCFQQLTDNVSIQMLASNLVLNLRRLDEDLYPSTVKTKLHQTVDHLQKLQSKPLLYLLAPERKPKPLRLLEPKIEPIYEDIRRRPAKNKELSLRDQRRKLQQRVKKESRAAAREIRQDNEFLAKMQFKRRVAGDRERREKVKRIFADATSQQGELKSLDRKAKYKK